MSEEQVRRELIDDLRWTSDKLQVRGYRSSASIIDRAITVLSQDAAIQQDTDSGISRIYEICNRYESGYGHGLKRDGLDLSKTPHSDAELGEAYQIGYEAGSERFDAHPQPATKPSEHAADAYVLTTGEESVLNKTLMRSVVQPQPATDKAELTDDTIAAIARDYFLPSSVVSFTRAVIAADRALRQPPNSAVRDGWVMAPREPTPESIQAGEILYYAPPDDCADSDEGVTELMKRIYKAMIAAGAKS
jgi:hypothetical protein